MPDSKVKPSLEDLAEEVFELSTLSSLARSRAKGGSADLLTEAEFLALNVLVKASPRTVGAIQKSIGVLPAQMSRVIRSLEDKGGTPYISCEINAEDRRRIDVHLTPEGRRAHDDFRKVRLGLTVDLLTELSPADRQEFMRLLRQMRLTIAKRLSDK